jgi:hypothetical protein
MCAKRNCKQNFRLGVTSVHGSGYVNESQHSDSGSKLGSLAIAETFSLAMTGITSENVSSLVRVCSYVVQQ